MDYTGILGQYVVFHRENKSSPFLIIDRPGNSTRCSILDEINQAKLILEFIQSLGAFGSHFFCYNHVTMSSNYECIVGRCR